MEMSKMFITILLLILTGCMWKVNAKSYTIKGNCEISNMGTLYVFLVDEQTRKKPMTGIEKLVILVDSCQEKKLIEFSFRNIPKGEYGIRCFLDINGNAKYDFNLFSTGEPWGMSWKNKRPSGKPDFKDYSFIVDSDIILRTIKIE
jgi:uncharacterized protein (DUF2141 family)